jgi:hypothetical protein
VSFIPGQFQIDAARCFASSKNIYQCSVAIFLTDSAQFEFFEIAMVLLLPPSDGMADWREGLMGGERRTYDHGGDEGLGR